MQSDRRRDRLSELPDAVILDILSFLEMRGAVQTTILSKRWKDLWTTVPRLEIRYENRRLIDGALAKWNGAKIKEFALGFDGITTASDIIDSWLHIPIDKQVERFWICMVCMNPRYCAPQRLYSCSSLTNVSLAYCHLRIDENVKVQWNQLKILSIEAIFDLSEDAMNRILCGAPLLEEFNLLGAKITENLNIRSTSLKTLRISGDDNDDALMKSVVMPGTTLTIWAPNLICFDISAAVYGTCSLDVPSLTDALIHFQEHHDDDDDDDDDNDDDDPPPFQMFDQFFGSLRHVEKLTLSDLSIQVLLGMKKNHRIVRFSNAKFLKLRVYSVEAKGLFDVLGMFPQLMNIIVEVDKAYGYTIDTEPQVAMVEASDVSIPKPTLPQLKTVEITCPICADSILPVVEIMLENAHVLEKMVLRLIDGGADEEIFMMAKNKVLSMPRSSPTAKVLIVMVTNRLL